MSNFWKSYKVSGGAYSFMNNQMKKKLVDNPKAPIEEILRIIQEEETASSYSDTIPRVFDEYLLDVF